MDLAGSERAKRTKAEGEACPSERLVGGACVTLSPTSLCWSFPVCGCLVSLLLLHMHSAVAGARLKEAIHINRGLLSLGNVINAIVDNHKHIPYRCGLPSMAPILQRHGCLHAPCFSGSACCRLEQWVQHTQCQLKVKLHTFLLPAGTAS